MFIKVRNHVAPNFTGEDLRIQVRGPLASYVYGYHVTPVTSEAHWYLSHQKGIIQGHPGHRYATREAFDLCSRIVFRAVFSLYVSTQTIFLYYISIKHNVRGHFLWFLCPCYALVAMPNRWNQYNFSTLHWLDIWEHRWILVLLLIFVDWYKHTNSNVSGSRCILNWFGCIIWRPKAICDENVNIT